MNTENYSQKSGYLSVSIEDLTKKKLVFEYEY